MSAMGSKLGNVLLVCLVAAVSQVAESKNIVFFFGVASYSHRIPAWPLVEALADKGHNVTFISSFAAKNPNPKIFDYVPNTLAKFMESVEDTMNVFEDRKTEKWLSTWLMVPIFGIMICQEIYKDEEYVNWVKSTKVDLVFVDALANDCAYGMAHYWGAKVILFDTSAPFSYFPEAYGLPDETSTIPGLELAYPINMSFFQRLTNALFPIAWLYYRKWYFFPQLEELTREKLGITNLPKFEELERNASLVFLNIHHAEEFARSLPPNVISIGGIAFNEKRKTLPKVNYHAMHCIYIVSYINLLIVGDGSVFGER